MLRGLGLEVTVTRQSCQERRSRRSTTRGAVNLNESENARRDSLEREES